MLVLLLLLEQTSRLFCSSSSISSSVNKLSLAVLFGEL